MFDDEILRIPKDEDDFWRIAQEQYEYAVMVLRDSAVEDEEDALRLVNDDATELKRKLKGLSDVVPFRGTSYALNNRDHFLSMGEELLPSIAKAIAARRLTPEFVQQWGKLMFCHGFIASYVLDDSDPMIHKRAGHKTGRKRSKSAQKKWLAHIVIALKDKGWTRQQAEAFAVDRIQDFVSDEKLRGGFPRNWFEVMITRGYLAATYDNKHFPIKEMRVLLEAPTDDIPPIPKIP